MIFSGISRRLSSVWHQALGYGRNGRALDVFPDDRFLVGYPKSGNTWLDFLVACLVAPEPDDVDFFTIEKIVADIYFNNARQLRRLRRPRHLKSHEPYDERYRRMIYIVRDPRDVAISYYHHQIKQRMIPADHDFSTFIQNFISGGSDGFGSWADHVDGWLRRRGDDREFMCVRYEDLKQDTAFWLGKIATHLELDVPEERLLAAVRWASVENMRRLEQRAARQGHPDFRNTKQDIPFVRKAESGGWKNGMRGECAEIIANAWGDVMGRLGYIA